MKLIDILKDNGYSEEAIQNFGMLIQPFVVQFIENQYAIAFTDEDLDQMEYISSEKELDELERDELITKIYYDKTGKKIDVEVEEFLNKIADDLNNHISKVRKLIDKIAQLPEDEFKSEFSEYLKVLEDIYLKDIQESISKMVQNKKDGEITDKTE